MVEGCCADADTNFHYRSCKPCERVSNAWNLVDMGCANCLKQGFTSSSKAKWKLRFRPICLEFTLTLLLILPVFASSKHDRFIYERCLQGKQFSGFTLRHSRYHLLGITRSFSQCKRMCCDDSSCNAALLFNKKCVKLSCNSSDEQKCKPARLHKRKVVLFIRGSSTEATLPQDNLKGEERESRLSSCRHYSGKVCAPYLHPTKLYQDTPEANERTISDAFSTLESYVSVACINFVLTTSCYNWFPQCHSEKELSLRKVCKADCLHMKKTVCKDEYMMANTDDSFNSLLPDCSKLNDDHGCIKLSFPEATKPKVDKKRKAEDDSLLSVTVSTMTPLTKQVQSTGKRPKKIHSLPLPTLTRKPHTTANRSTLGTTSTPPKPTSYPRVIVSTEWLTLHNKNKSHAVTPVILKGTSGVEEIDLAEKVAKTVAAANSVAPTTSPVSSIKVSAGENKVITLPENKVSLYASTWPKPAEGVMYNYKWIQVAAPEKSRGYMEGKDTSRLTLTMLDVPGIYQFKVTVSSEHAHGEGFVNVTVKPVPRVNRPPRADIQPREQTVTLPVKSVVLSGSTSTDDDKIVSFKWEEVKGPMADQGKTVMVGIDKDVVQIKNLAPGVYTFKLTVTDSDGEQDQTEATVTVKEEKDYPPVARAGDGVILTLPENHVTLYGNGSTDDKKIEKYEWTKSPDSPTTGDMLGTNKPVLTVSNLVVGHYTFVLQVTDSAGQTSESKVTVIVKPEKNAAPTAVAGPDKDLVYPDDSTTLDASKSADDQGNLKFHWEQESGPKGAVMSDPNKAKLQLSGLKEGHYVFKVTVTDEKGLSGSDTVTVNVKKDVNEAPVARAGPDVTVILPNRAAVLDGSRSTDDQFISSYEWSRDGKSPAAGDIINGSNHQPILRLTNLVEGLYTFTLVVTDNKGLKGSDAAIVSVRQDESSLYLVELYLEVDITQFTEESKRQLLRKLSVLLNVEDGNVVVEELRRAAYGTGLMIVFYVTDPNLNKKIDGQAVANVLKQKVGYHGTLFEYKMLKVEPFVCRNNCSGHGYCDKNTKQCVCDGFWMQDIFKSYFGARESNCDWSILYVTVIVFGIVVAVIALTWAFCFLYARRKKARRRLRYIPVHNEDDDTKEEIMMIPKGKYLAHSLTFTESDEDSEEETTVFDKKIIVNGSAYPNGSANGLVPRKSRAT